MGELPFPPRLSFAEEGYYEQPSWSRNPDDEVWISTGWKAVSYEGHVHFHHVDRAW